MRQRHAAHAINDAGQRDHGANLVSVAGFRAAASGRTARGIGRRALGCSSCWGAVCCAGGVSIASIGGLSTPRLLVAELPLPNGAPAVQPRLRVVPI